MKTLIFNGSPRKKGDTAFLIQRLKAGLQGEVLVIDTHNSPIKPCTDCRYCWKKPGCSIPDEMQAVYAYIKDCDNIVIASPIYFSELTGTLLAVCSRLQTFYASRRFLKISQIAKKKKGAVILCGGGEGAPEKAQSTAKTILREMNAELVGMVQSLHTDRVPAREDQNALQELGALIELLNQQPLQ